jgi:hypothetical protein
MRTSLVLLILFAIVQNSCNSNEEATPAVDITLSFNHLVDNEPVIMDDIRYKNALDQEFSIKTIKYFISEIKLYRKDGSALSFDDIHYIDQRTSETLYHTLSKKVPLGEYTGISFVHGLSPTENITGRFTEPPESLMEWPMMMGGGYHYMKLEGEYRTQGATSFFNFHSGALDGTPYEVEVNLDNQAFEVTGKPQEVLIKMEIQEWFRDPVDWDFTYFGSAIMGNAEAQQTVQRNGASVYSFDITERLE